MDCHNISSLIRAITVIAPTTVIAAYWRNKGRSSNKAHSRNVVYNTTRRCNIGMIYQKLRQSRGEAVARSQLIALSQHTLL